MSPPQCTCGPFPTIDATTTATTTREGGVAGLRRSLLEACRSHGCFHLIVDRPPTSSSPDDSWSFARGCDPRESIGTLFDECRVPGSVTGTADGRSSAYRGRTAESGDASASGGTNAEPKQSWEYRRRCIGDVDHDDDDPIDATLRAWTDDLHGVARQLSDWLDLPDGLVVGGGCDCDSSGGKDAGGNGCDSYGGRDGRRGRRCNSDLLRVFRYDPVAAGAADGDDDDDDAITAPSLGSSPHTDWGTLTVVWQDGVGGLQAYCHAHDTWSDVVPPSSSGIGGDEDGTRIHLFVHVGDFLSLASGAGRAGRTGWPSPRHRVLSPRGTGERYSLVYFVYPRPGLTLADAGGAFRRSLDVDVDGGGATAPDPDLDPSALGRYSLLHDQSASASADADDAEAVLRVYREIRDAPFNGVVERKWAQVQRG